MISSSSLRLYVKTHLLPIALFPIGRSPTSQTLSLISSSSVRIASSHRSASVPSKASWAFFGSDASIHTLPVCISQIHNTLLPALLPASLVCNKWIHNSVLPAYPLWLIFLVFGHLLEPALHELFLHKVALLTYCSVGILLSRRLLFRISSLSSSSSDITKTSSLDPHACGLAPLLIEVLGMERCVLQMSHQLLQ